MEQLKTVLVELKNEYPNADLTSFEKQKIDEATNANGGGGRRITQNNNKIETKVITHKLENESLICHLCY